MSKTENIGQLYEDTKVKLFNLEITIRAVTQNDIAELLARVRDIRGYSFEIKTTDFETKVIHT